MAIPPILAQLAVPAAAQLVSKLFSTASQAKQPVAPPSPEVIQQQQQLLAQSTGKGLKINLYT